jgi:flagellum-specific peptidoglycan hydrolase FlgJ
MPTPQQLNYLRTMYLAAKSANHPQPGPAAAEAANETGWGAHVPAGSNNELGIKAYHGWKGSVVGAKGTEQNPDGSWTGPQNDLWAVFPSPEACFAEQWKIITTNRLKDGSLRYAKALEAKTPEEYIAAECPIWSTNQQKAQQVLLTYHSHLDILG